MSVATRREGGGGEGGMEREGERGEDVYRLQTQTMGSSLIVRGCYHWTGEGCSSHWSE